MDGKAFPCEIATMGTLAILPVDDFQAYFLPSSTPTGRNATDPKGGVFAGLALFSVGNQTRSRAEAGFVGRLAHNPGLKLKRFAALFTAELKRINPPHILFAAHIFGLKPGRIVRGWLADFIHTPCVGKAETVSGAVAASTALDFTIRNVEHLTTFFARSFSPRLFGGHSASFSLMILYHTLWELAQRRMMREQAACVEQIALFEQEVA